MSESGGGFLEGLKAVTDIVTVGANAYSVYQQGRASAVVNDHNIAMAEYDARYNKLVTDTELRRLKETEARLVGRARAIAGASGFATNVGSNKDAIKDIRRGIAIDASAIRIAGYRGQLDIQSSVSQYVLQGAQEQAAHRMKLASTLVSGADTLSSAFVKRKIREDR